MNDLDDALRTMLAERADDAPSATGLLEAVGVRRRRQRQRVFALTGSVTVVAALAAGGAVSYVTSRPDRTTLEVSTPGAGYERPPASPVTLGWLPAGFGKPSVQLSGPTTWILSADRTGSKANSLVVLVDTGPLTLRPGRYASFDVGDGVVGRYYHDPHELELIYQPRPGLWIRIIELAGKGTIDIESGTRELRGIATGLVEEPSPVPDVVRLSWLPDSLRWSGVTSTPDGVEVELVDAVRGRPTEPSGGVSPRVVNLSVVRTDSYWTSTGGTGSPARIPADGLVRHAGDETVVLYPLRGRPGIVTVVRIAARGSVISVAEAKHLAAGVRLGPDATIKPSR